MNNQSAIDNLARTHYDIEHLLRCINELKTWLALNAGAAVSEIFNKRNQLEGFETDLNNAKRLFNAQITLVEPYILK